MPERQTRRLDPSPRTKVARDILPHVAEMPDKLPLGQPQSQEERSIPQGSPGSILRLIKFPKRERPPQRRPKQQRSNLDQAASAAGSMPPMANVSAQMTT